MNKKLTLLMTVTVMAASIFFMGGFAIAADRYVDDDSICGGNTPCDTTIQAAINAASDGQIIEVYAGLYTENVNVNKELTIQAEAGLISPIVDGGGSGSCFNIYLSSGLDGVIIDGFEIKNAVRGIWIFGDPTTYSDITISNNYIHSHTQNGILVTDATVNSLTISDNRVSAGCSGGGQIGISFANTSTIIDLIVDGNNITGNCAGLSLIDDTFTNVAVTNCNFQGNAWEDIDLGLWGSFATLTNIQISDCSFTGGGVWTAIYVDQTSLYSASDIHINYNNFSGSWAGIYNFNSTTVDGLCNWWGAADGPSVVGSGSGVGVSDEVDYEPWLLGPGPDGQCGADSVGDCISYLINLNCSGLTGKDRAACNHDQQDICFNMFGQGRP
jgi:hypothetical protein